ncbi:MAG: signal peptide peptidase SppA [Flavobacteriales bacterium]|nr:signal peptide peptidase SppA [Flavobacteriales bacterium]
MLKFLKYVLATMVALFLSVLVLCGIILALASSGETEITVKPQSILTINLGKDISDRSGPAAFDPLGSPSSFFETKIGLNDILKSIQYAKSDDNIAGVYLKVGNGSTSLAILDEIRNQLLDFKTSEKFIVSYGENYSQKSYYIASVCDTIYINPQGLLEFKGLGTIVRFYKKTLEKLNLKPRVFRHGKFKSFVEPFTREDMSKENKEQKQKLLSSIWGNMLNRISTERNIDPTSLNNIADSILIRNSEGAVDYMLADGIAFEDEFKSLLKSHLGKGEKDKLNFISISQYSKTIAEPKSLSSDQIAIIYATGEIVSHGNEYNEENMVASKICKAIKKAREDNNIKAIVLRINSPGGSALASDVIWREAVLASNKKPFVASLSSVAASGGYYIASAADTIISGENTITGSIGVFGLLLNMEGFYNMLGVSHDRVNTNSLSDFASSTREMTDLEQEIIQGRIEEIYDDFLLKVSQGRGISTAEVDSIGQGRVWSGSDAINIGLVDINGGLLKAIEVAAKMANIENFEITELPKQLDPLDQFISELTGEYETRIMKQQLGIHYDTWKNFQSLTKQTGILAKMPHTFEVE